MGRSKKEDSVVDTDTKNDPIKNLMGSLLSGYKEDVYNHVINERIPISAGSLTLDSLIKIKTGSVIRLAGPLESGKTSQLLLIMLNYLNTVPKSRGLYVKAEGRLSEEMQARSGLKFVFSDRDWEIGTVFVLESNIFEAVSDIIYATLKNMYEKGERLVFAIDSLDGLILKSDMEKFSNCADKLKPDNKASGMMPAGVPKMTKMFFRRMALAINKYDALALLTSQYSETFKIAMYEKDKPQPVQGSGGSAVSHQPDWILEYGIRYHGDYIMQDPNNKKPDPKTNKILGHEVKITLRKSTNENTGLPIRIPIKYGRVGNSIWLERETIDLALGFGLISKINQKTLAFSAEIVVQAKESGIELKENHNGFEALYAYFEENKLPFEWLYKKIKDVIT